MLCWASCLFPHTCVESYQSHHEPHTFFFTDAQRCGTHTTPRARPPPRAPLTSRRHCTQVGSAQTLQPSIWEHVCSCSWVEEEGLLLKPVPSTINTPSTPQQQPTTPRNSTHQTVRSAGKRWEEAVALFACPGSLALFCFAGQHVALCLQPARSLPGACVWLYRVFSDLMLLFLSVTTTRHPVLPVVAGPAAGQPCTITGPAAGQLCTTTQSRSSK